jgi:hypothetical protein
MKVIITGLNLQCIIIIVIIVVVVVVVVIVVMINSTRSYGSRNWCIADLDIFWLTLACLYHILFHTKWSINAMQLKVKAASITNSITMSISTPQRCCCCLAVTTRQTSTPRSRLSKKGKIEGILNFTVKT